MNHLPFSEESYQVGQMVFYVDADSHLLTPGFIAEKSLRRGGFGCEQYTVLTLTGEEKYGLTCSQLRPNTKAMQDAMRHEAHQAHLRAYGEYAVSVVVSGAETLAA